MRVMVWCIVMCYAVLLFFALSLVVVHCGVPYAGMCCSVMCWRVLCCSVTGMHRYYGLCVVAWYAVVYVVVVLCGVPCVA